MSKLLNELLKYSRLDQPNEAETDIDKELEDLLALDGEEKPEDGDQPSEEPTDDVVDPEINPEDMPSDDEIAADFPEFATGGGSGASADVGIEGEPTDELGDDEDSIGDESNPAVPEEPQDPNRAGLIRKVPGAHLVYKRAREDGTFSELWQYKVDSIKQGVAVRNAILAGTDIERNRTTSDDGAQEYKTWSAGNVEMISITGLPS